MEATIDRALSAPFPQPADSYDEFRS
jgi:hypothetical protein